MRSPKDTATLASSATGYTTKNHHFLGFFSPIHRRPAPASEEEQGRKEGFFLWAKGGGFGAPSRLRWSAAPAFSEEALCGGGVLTERRCRRRWWSERRATCSSVRTGRRTWRSATSSIGILGEDDQNFNLFTSGIQFSVYSTVLLLIPFLSRLVGDNSDHRIV